MAIYHGGENQSAKEIIREGEMVLSEVNFEVSRGEFVYLIGRVGSGKTTFLREISHILSSDCLKSVCVIDEKNEIFLQNQNYGNCIDFLKNIKKILAFLKKVCYNCL